jgi:hypothetical protein
MILRKFSLAIVACLLLPTVASAASGHGGRQVYHWHGYGFLPGYHQPPNPGKCIPGCSDRRGSVYEPMAQYSSASMMVMTRLVTAGSAGSGE